jgi:TatD DNase family protein
MLTDTHCHILSAEYENPQLILESLHENNIKQIINNGYDYNSNEEVIELCNKYSNVYGAIGLHPDNIGENSSLVIQQIKDNINNKKIIAIGEIGLDYFHNKDNKVEQIKILKELLSIAEENNKPVIIHSRDATSDMIKILKDYHLKGIIHCFSGSYETANEYIKMGYKLGINGILTFKKCKLGDVLKKLPISAFVLETDSPYLTPEPLRGESNKPQNIKYTFQKLSEILSIPQEQLSSILDNNLKEIFDNFI